VEPRRFDPGDLLLAAALRRLVVCLKSVWLTGVLFCPVGSPGAVVDESNGNVLVVQDKNKVCTGQNRVRNIRPGSVTRYQTSGLQTSPALNKCSGMMLGVVFTVKD